MQKEQKDAVNLLKKLLTSQFLGVHLGGVVEGVVEGREERPGKLEVGVGGKERRRGRQQTPRDLPRVQGEPVVLGNLLLLDQGLGLASRAVLVVRVFLHVQCSVDIGQQE